MAGRGVEVHVALTSDVGKILSLSHGIKIGEKANLMGSIQVAQLALKHRQNKTERQRIVAFVAPASWFHVETRHPPVIQIVVRR